MGVLFRHTGFSKSADDAASCRPGHCADGGRRQPTGRDNWSHPRDRKQAQAGQKSRGATDAGSDAGTFACALCAVIYAVAVPIYLLVGVEPAVRVLATMLMSECEVLRRSGAVERPPEPGCVYRKDEKS